MTALSLWIFTMILLLGMLNQAQFNISRAVVLDDLRSYTTAVAKYYSRFIGEKQLYINVQGNVPYNADIFAGLASSTADIAGYTFDLKTEAVDTRTVKVQVLSTGPYNTEFSSTNYINISDFTIAAKLGGLDFIHDLSWCATDVDPSRLHYVGQVFAFDSGTSITDVAGFADYIVVSTDDTVKAHPDLFLLRVAINATGTIPIVTKLSSIDSGLGITSVYPNYPYLYAGTLEASHQLQIFDITWPSTPQLIATSSLRDSSTTTPIIRALAYRERDHTLHIGTEKWPGPEYLIMDMSSTTAPILAGAFEVGAIVKDIYNAWPYSYLSTGSQNQLLSLRTDTPSTVRTSGGFVSLTPSGWQTQQGSALRRQGNRIWWGRTVGGFNNIHNHELFYFDPMSSTSPMELPPFAPLPNSMSGGSYEFTGQIKVGTSTDIGASVKDVVAGHDYAFLLTNLIGKEVLVYRAIESSLVFDRSIGITGSPVKFWCSGNNIFVAMNNPPRLVLLQDD